MFTEDILYFILLLMFIFCVGLWMFYVKFKNYRQQLCILIWGSVLGTIINIVILYILWNLPIDFPWKSSLYLSPIVPGILYLLIFHLLSRFQHYTYTWTLAVIMALIVYAILYNKVIYYLLILLPADLIDNFIIH